MRLRFEHSASLGQKIKEGHNIDLSKELSASGLVEEDEQERDQAPDGEPPEPPALEDLADMRASTLLAIADGERT